jgi:hypothetical protein
MKRILLPLLTAAGFALTALPASAWVFVAPPIPVPVPAGPPAYYYPPPDDYPGWVWGADGHWHRRPYYRHYHGGWY